MDIIKYVYKYILLYLLDNIINDTSERFEENNYLRVLDSTQDIVVNGMPNINSFGEINRMNRWF